jgi:hypothetical protein
MCGHHMVSETSVPRFVFRSRGSPACRSTECVKMQFHVQREEPEREIIDGGFSCFWCVYTKDHVCHQEYVWSHRCWMTTKNNMVSASSFLTSCLWGQKRPGPGRLLCVFGALFRYGRTLPRMIAGLHLHASTCSCMSQDRSGCSPHIVKPWRESLRILCHVFIRKMYGLVFVSQLKSRVDLTLGKTAGLRIKLNCWSNRRGVYYFNNTYSPIGLVNISSVNLVFIFRCSSSPINPVYVRRIDYSSTLVFSLSSHRHSYRCYL